MNAKGDATIHKSLLDYISNTMVMTSGAGS